MKRTTHYCTASIAAAILCAASALCQTSGNPLTHARALMEAGKIQEAEADIRAYLAVNPSSPDAHFLLGYVLFRDQKATESLAELTAGARLRHPHPDELKIVGADYVLLNDFSDADKWFSQVVTESPYDAGSWYLLGRTKFNENQYAAAISSFERSLALRPGDVEAENNIGLCWKALNDKEKAQAAFASAIEWQGQTPSNPHPYFNLGALLADERKNRDALSYLKKAVALSPKDASVHEQLGKVYLAMNKLPEAQSELEQAIAMGPDTADLHFTFAQILRKQGQAERAQQEFDRGAKLKAAHPSPTVPAPSAVAPPK